MTIVDKIKDKKLQYDINRQAAKISAILSSKVYKFEYLTSEELLASDQSRTIEQDKSAYYPLGKAFEKQIKTNENQGRTQAEALKVLKTTEQKLTIKDAIQDQLNEEVKNEIVKSEDLVY